MTYVLLATARGRCPWGATYVIIRFVIVSIVVISSSINDTYSGLSIG